MEQQEEDYVVTRLETIERTLIDGYSIVTFKLSTDDYFCTVIFRAFSLLLPDNMFAVAFPVSQKQAEGSHRHWVDYVLQNKPNTKELAKLAKTALETKWK